MEPKTQKKQVKNWIILASVCVFLFLTSITLSLLPNLRNTPDEPQDTEIENQDIVKLDPVENKDKSKIIYQKKEISLPSGFEVTTIARELPKNFFCQKLEQCDLYYVSNIKKKVNYYFSTPDQVLVAEDFSNRIVYEKLNIKGKEYDFVYRTAFLYGDDEKDTVSDSKLIIQVYGCLTENICFNSGNLDLDLKKNKAQFNDVKAFLNSLIIK